MNNLSYFADFPKSIGFDVLENTVVELLQENKFGVLTEIDVKATFKKKLDIDFRPYKILGACNPPRANKVLNADPELGLLLPCNVIIYETADSIRVSMVNAGAMFEMIQNPAIEDIAKEVSEIFNSIIEKMKKKFS